MVKQRWRSGFRTKQEAEEALSLPQDTLNPRGRPPRTDSEYARIARIYIAKLATRTETNRNAAGIAAEMAAEADMPVATMKGWLHGARQRGFCAALLPCPRPQHPRRGKRDRSSVRTDAGDQRLRVPRWIPLLAGLPSLRCGSPSMWDRRPGGSAPHKARR